MVSKPRNFSSQFVYHIYNRSIPEIGLLFPTDRDYKRFLSTIAYYLHKQPISYAQFLDLPLPARKQFLYGLDPKGLGERRVKILAYCPMPNHFHILLQPHQVPSEISAFLADITNSYTRYFNLKYKRRGALFESTYKAKEIADDASLLEVTRYIHLNPPLSSKANPRGWLKNPEDYPYSSYREWVGLANPYLVHPQDIEPWIKQTQGPKGYAEFVNSKLGGNPALGIEPLTLEDEDDQIRP